MPHAVMLAFTSPTSSDADEDFNAWYTGKHIHDLVKLPGVIAATRYKLVHGIELLPGVGGPAQKYMAIYEIEGETDEELAQFAAMLREALQDGRADIHTTLDMGDLGAAFALPISERLERAETVPASGRTSR
jgi:hypothetical protein